MIDNMTPEQHAAWLTEVRRRTAAHYKVQDYVKGIITLEELHAEVIEVLLTVR